MSRLHRGDLLPQMVTPPPGPETVRLAAELERWEAPGINTLQGGTTAMLWEEALGANVLDVDGNRYIDLTSGFGVATIGHRHPEVVAAVQQQSERLLHGLGDLYAHELRVELAKRLCQISPIEDTRVHFAVSGADAVEIALKTAELHTGKPDVLCFEPSYHGLTLGALAVSSRPEFREPFRSRLGGWVYRLPYGAPAPEIDELLGEQRSIGACIFEPVVGREGLILPPDRWLTDLGEVARRHSVLLVADEIFTGFGRCGDWFHTSTTDVRPDLICCGKALAGGMPIGAVLGSRAVMNSWSVNGEALHTGTFVAAPLACASALATLDLLHGLIGSEAVIALGDRLAAIVAAAPVENTRSVGLAAALELPSGQLAAALAQTLLLNGVIALRGGPDGKIVQLLPPASITEAQLDFVAEVLDARLADTPWPSIEGKT